MQVIDGGQFGQHVEAGLFLQVLQYREDLAHVNDDAQVVAELLGAEALGSEVLMQFRQRGVVVHAPTPAGTPRRFRTTRTPPFGRRLSSASGSGSAISDTSTRKRCNIVATIRVIPMMAKVLPMHWCGPAPKAIQAQCGIDSARPGAQRPGSNLSGSGNQRGSRCTTQGQT